MRFNRNKVKIPFAGTSGALAKTKDKDWITLNIGGVRVTTTKDTLTNKEPDSMLARMFSQEEGMSMWRSPCKLRTKL